jgi:DNA-binding transcriptional LysR family regulator
MELRHLRYFVSVAEAASVSKAALRVRISQPALSRQIHDLEEELGVRLFDRIGRRIQLTAEGEELLARSRDLLARAGSLAERARALSGGAAGVLRVGATPQAMQSVVAGVLNRYLRRWPEVEVRLTEEGGLRLLDLVERGELHVALAGVPLGSGLESRPLFPIRLLAVGAPRQRWRRLKVIEVEEIAAGERLLLLRRDFGTRQLFDAACRLAHIEPRVALESREPHSLVTLAEGGHGVAVVPSTVRFLSRRIQILPLIQEGRSLGTWGGVVWDPRRSLPRHASGFIEELAAYVSREFPGKRFDRTAPPLPVRPSGAGPSS